MPDLARKSKVASVLIEAGLRSDRAKNAVGYPQVEYLKIHIDDNKVTRKGFISTSKTIGGSTTLTRRVPITQWLLGENNGYIRNEYIRDIDLASQHTRIELVLEHDGTGDWYLEPPILEVKYLDGSHVKGAIGSRLSGTSSSVNPVLDLAVPILPPTGWKLV